MLSVRTAAQIRGARTLKGFRSCAASTGVPVRRADIYRLLRAEAGLANSELRRRWLAKRWDAHQTRVRHERGGNNPTIKALRLPVQREMLDSQVYLLRLDGQLNVVAYGLSDDVARTVKER